MEIFNDHLQTGMKTGMETMKGVLSSIRAMPELPPQRLDDQVAIITGANSGIGKETAREFIKRGAKVILACRDEQKGQATARELGREGGKVVFMRLDLAKLSSVEEFCKRIQREEASIDILVNNAGVFCLEKVMTEDGYELQFQVNHLGHFLLTNLLMDKLKAKDGGRIINVSSVAHWMSIGIPQDVNWEYVRYNGFLAYSNSKLANVLFSTELIKRLKGSSVSVYSLHPGGVATNLGRNIAPYIPDQISGPIASAFNYMAKSPADGAKTTLYCALAPNLPSGYYDDMQKGWMSPLGKNMEMTRTLWSQSEELLGYKSKI